ncbi:MAG: hypothetical protein LBH04_09950 [Tannerellaceae bacterium]|jgi:hypothetical protein|nr:hypothetical protein [Tannerellaceae bacterium]
MKRIITYILLVASAMALASCLDGGNEKVSLGNYPGVVMLRDDSTFVCVKGGDILYTRSGLSSVLDGDCVIVDFTYDRGAADNLDSGRVKDHLAVDIKRMTSVPSSSLKPSLTDTTTAIHGERTISAVYDFNAFIRDRFFLLTGHKADSLPLAFELSCDLSRASTGGVYDLFLRVYPQSSTQATQPVTMANAFNLGGLSARETDSLFFRICYVRQFNSDSSVISWASTPVFRYGILR